MPRPIQQPTVDERGNETHPAYGHVSVNRMSCTPGETLFDSEIRHNQVIRLTLSHAERKRELGHNWIFERDTIAEIELSEAQWASLVSSLNTGGVPCTITRTQEMPQVSALPFKPVLGESMAEVRESAHKAFDAIQEAFEAWEAASKAPAAERREALRTLRAAIANAPKNVEFAAGTLNKHTENVVQKAKADVEAMVVRATQQQALEAGAHPLLELEP